MEVKRRAHPQHHTLNPAPVRGHPALLLGAAQPHKHQTRTAGVDARHGCVVFLGRELPKRWRFHRHLQPWKGRLQTPLQQGQGVFGTAVTIDGQVFCRATFDQPPHHIRAGNSGLIREALAPQHPGHRCTVGRGHVCLVDHLGVCRVLLCDHQHMRVADGHVAALSGVGPGHQAIQRTVPVHSINA